MTSTTISGNLFVAPDAEVRQDLGRLLPRPRHAAQGTVPTVILPRQGRRLQDTAVMEPVISSEPQASSGPRHAAVKPRPGGRMWIVYLLHTYLGLSELRSFLGAASMVFAVLLGLAAVGAVATAHYFSGFAYSMGASLGVLGAASLLAFGPEPLVNLGSGAAWVLAGVLNIGALVRRFRRNQADKTSRRNHRR